MANRHSNRVDPDRDLFVASLRRAGADDEVIERAKAQVTAENFVPEPEREHATA